MSRVELFLKDPNSNVTAISVGLDHATGYFFQLFVESANADDDDVCLIDQDQVFTGLTRSKLVNLIKEHARPDQMMSYVIKQIHLDLDPADGCPVVDLYGQKKEGQEWTGYE